MAVIFLKSSEAAAPQDGSFGRVIRRVHVYRSAHQAATHLGSSSRLSLEATSQEAKQADHRHLRVVAMNTPLEKNVGTCEQGRCNASEEK